MLGEGSGFPEGDNAMLLISLPADSTTPCLIQIYDFLYNPDSLLSYSIAVEARGSTSSNAPTIEDDLSLYWRIQLGCGSPDNKMSVLPPPAGFRHVVIAPADPPHPAPQSANFVLYPQNGVLVRTKAGFSATYPQIRPFLRTAYPYSVRCRQGPGFPLPESGGDTSSGARPCQLYPADEM